ncbi:MAG TPA: response regulator transcription factor [Actinomycetota bacterium]|nr:response regulator transcription factor [Actinomycetota bacterium]
MTVSRVLVVDDDPQIRRAITTSLRARRFEVAAAADGEEALTKLAAGEFDCVILDLGLPGIDGHEVIRRLREWSPIPVIVLSVRDSQHDKIDALDAGADDYVTKPFAMDELLARMRAIERRAATDKPPPVLHFGELEIDLARQLVRLGGAAVPLTPTEYRLLTAMASHPGKLLTHQWLLGKVWGPGYTSESLRVYVKQLRHKLGEDPVRPRWITTEPGMGYRWSADPAE